MIRPEYRDMLVEQRKGNPGWGGSAVRNAGDHVVRWLNKRKDIQTVLDFGCGVGTLGEYVGERAERFVNWYEYDPSVAGKDELPTRTFDAIITTDVLEHIEPCSLDSTLAWIREHATRSQFHHIDCNDNKDLLPDGRSVHLIVEEMDWWEMQLLGVEPEWITMYFSQIAQRKRGRMRYSGTLILDRS